jgi:hypothetical protein
MNSLRLTLWQVRYTNKAYWRNPAAAFFTFLFPLMFLVIFTALLGHGHIALSGHRISLSPTTSPPWPRLPSSARPT